jgi:hypothetical protein
VAIHNCYWSNTASDALNLPLSRLKMLWRLLDVSKRFLERLIAVPNVKMFKSPYPIRHRFCYAVIVFVRTIFFNHGPFGEAFDHHLPQQASNEVPLINIPGISNKVWDPVLAAQTADMPRIGILLGDKMQAMAEHTGLPAGQRGAFDHFAVSMKNMMFGYERQMAKLTSGSVENTLAERDGLGQDYSGQSDSLTQANTDSGLGHQGMPYISQQDFESLLWDTNLMSDFSAFLQS